MNLNNINKLIDHLESLGPNQFNWNIYSNDCGTCACVAGWTCLLFDGVEEMKSLTQNDCTLSGLSLLDSWYWIDKAQKHLGLTDEQVSLLFYPLQDNLLSSIKFSEPYDFSAAAIYADPRYGTLTKNHSWEKSDIEHDIQFLINLIGREEIEELEHNPKLMAKLIRSYVSKWQLEGA